MSLEQLPTKILFLDDDEVSFEFRKCMAKVLGALPPVEMFHAKDATEALQLLESLEPDVVVLDGELIHERDLFLDSLHGEHPPVVVQAAEEESRSARIVKDSVTVIPKNESLDGIHQTLLLASQLGSETNQTQAPKVVH